MTDASHGFPKTQATKVRILDAPFYDRFDDGRNSKIGVQEGAHTRTRRPRFTSFSPAPVSRLKVKPTRNSSSRTTRRTTTLPTAEVPAATTTRRWPRLQRARPEFYHRPHRTADHLWRVDADDERRRRVPDGEFCHDVPASMTGAFGDIVRDGDDATGSSVTDIYLLTKTTTPGEVDLPAPPTAPVASRRDHWQQPVFSFERTSLGGTDGNWTSWAIHFKFQGASHTGTYLFRWS